MSATTQVTDFSDLITDFISSARDQVGVTAINNVVKRYLNRGLLDMHVNPGNFVPWAIRSGMLTTHDDYTTGTVSITIATSRTAVTGASTTWNTLATGYTFNNVRARGRIVFSGSLDVHTVSSVTSDTALVLVDNYVGTANLSGATYTYFEDEYALVSDFLRPVNLRSFSTELDIPLIGSAEFKRLYPRNANPGPPRVAMTTQLSFSGNTTPRLRVVLHPPPDAVYLIPYDYITSNLAVTSAGVEQAQLSGDTDEPIVPLRYRHLIVLNALRLWYMFELDNQATADKTKLEFIDLMSRVKGDTSIGQDRPRFMPQAMFKLGLRTRRGRWGSGTSFDQLRDR